MESSSDIQLLSLKPFNYFYEVIDMTIAGIELIEAAGTSAGNFDMNTLAIRDRIQSWSNICNLRVVSADRASVQINFDTLPKDMESFTAEIYSFCPDIIDQGVGCVGEMIEEMGVPPNLVGLVEDIDFSNDNYGLELLKRLISRDRKVKLWWD